MSKSVLYIFCQAIEFYHSSNDFRQKIHCVSHKQKRHSSNHNSFHYRKVEFACKTSTIYTISISQQSTNFSLSFYGRTTNEPNSVFALPFYDKSTRHWFCWLRKIYGPTLNGVERNLFERFALTVIDWQQLGGSKKYTHIHTFRMENCSLFPLCCLSSGFWIHLITPTWEWEHEAGNRYGFACDRMKLKFH